MLMEKKNINSKLNRVSYREIKSNVSIKFKAILSTFCRYWRSKYKYRYKYKYKYKYKYRYKYRYKYKYKYKCKYRKNVSLFFNTI